MTDLPDYRLDEPDRYADEPEPAEDDSAPECVECMERAADVVSQYDRKPRCHDCDRESRGGRCSAFEVVDHAAE